MQYLTLRIRILSLRKHLGHRLLIIIYKPDVIILVSVSYEYLQFSSSMQLKALTLICLATGIVAQCDSAGTWVGDSHFMR